MSGPATARRANLWRWAALAGTVATLAILVWRLGTGPFLDGLRAVDGQALTAAAVIMALTTVLSAWRWTIVARGLGVDIPLRAAVASYYRSQFLNLTLPGGVVGDVHRGISHGRDVRDVSRALRAVMWERLAGQTVQVILTVLVLLALPSPVHSAMPLVAVLLVVAVIGIAVAARALPGRGPSRWARVRGAVSADIRDGLLAGRAWVGIGVASALVVAGHATTFIIAAQATGTVASVSTMLPLALLAMVAMAVPSAAGIGPREGATAWAFAAAGLGAERGVATAVAFGVMVLVASLPGALVLLAGVTRGLPSGVKRVDAAAVAVRSDGAADG